MQGIYNYVPETKRFSRAYCVAAILQSQCVTRSAISRVKSLILLHQYFFQYVCSAQCGCYM
jgi:hypothetical protein